MIVFKNNVRLGVKQVWPRSGRGRAGVKYRWAVSMLHQNDSARIDMVPAAEVEALVQAERALAAQQKALVQEQMAQRQRERLAMIASEQDLALPAGTRLRVQMGGGRTNVGVYERWERREFGTNRHFIDFASEGGGMQQVALKGRSLSQLSVLPPLVVTLHVLQIAGGEPMEVEGVSLGWSVSQLNATIAERRGVPAELQRLVVGEVVLDDPDAVLSSCGVGEGTLVHVVVARMEGAAAERHVAGPAAAASRIAEAQPPQPHRRRQQQQQQRQQQRARGGGWCCASPT